MRKRPFQRRGDLSGIYQESLLEQTEATESILIPLSGCENVPKCAGRQCVPAMMVVDDDSPTIGMPIHPLAAFEPPVHKAVAFQRPDQLPDRNVPQLLDHTVTATAGRSISSIFPAARGIESPASTISST